MLHVLVTGGAGFIGSHIVDFLLNKKYKVRVVDNLSTGYIDNIKHHMNNPDFEFINGDLTNFNVVMDVCKNIDAICHQAAIGSITRSIDDPYNSHNNNVNAFVNILLAAKNHNIKRIVYASSSSVYGDSPSLLKTENYIGKQLSPYAITKYVDELYGYIFSCTYDMECIGLRYFNVFGPRQNKNGNYAAVIPKFINNFINNEQSIINGDGWQSRDFTYIDNVVMANYLSLTTKNKQCFGDVFNIGTSSSFSVLYIYDVIKKYFKSDMNPKYCERKKCDILNSLANVEKAKLLLNYEPLCSFDLFLNNTIKFYIDNKS
jgi:UDP-N-acetylglucosamine 4-epimerase